MERTETLTVDVCPHALAGGFIDMEPDGDGQMRCRRCGATTAIVMASASMVSDDWRAGGNGYRRPLPHERTMHWEEHA